MIGFCCLCTYGIDTCYQAAPAVDLLYIPVALGAMENHRTALRIHGHGGDLAKAVLLGGPVLHEHGSRHTGRRKWHVVVAALVLQGHCIIVGHWHCQLWVLRLREPLLLEPPLDERPHLVEEALVEVDTWSQVHGQACWQVVAAAGRHTSQAYG